MFTQTERLIAIRNLRPRRKQGFLKIISLFSYLGITMGVAILIIVMSVMNGFRADLTEKIIGLNPHLILQLENEKDLKKIKKKLAEKYQRIRFTESISGEGIILTNNKAKGILIKGINEKYKSQSFLNKEITKGNLNDFSNGRVMIGGELAYNLDLEIGDKINIVSSSFVNTPFGNIPMQDSFVIAGFFNSGFYEFDQNLIYLELNDSRSIFNIDKENIDLELFLEDPFLAEKYKKEIENINQNVFVSTWSDTNKSFFNALKIERNVMFIILTLIIIVAAFNIISGLTILVKNKTKDIAILKSIGVLNKSIVKIFFLIGIIIGTSATIFGIFLGVTFSLYVENLRQFLSSTFNISLFPEEIYFLSKMPSEINLNSILIISICSIFITIVVSIFPALKAAKLDPIKALKYE